MLCHGVWGRKVVGAVLEGACGRYLCESGKENSRVQFSVEPRLMMVPEKECLWL